MLQSSVACLLIGSVAVLTFSAVAATASSAGKLDNSWKHYRNAQWGYCVTYPSHWTKGDAFEGSGLFVNVGAKPFSKPIGEIDVAAVPLPPKGSEEAASLTLVDDLQTHLDGLAKFERAERMEVLDQHPLDLLGNAALFIKDKYYDPLDRSTWTEELVFVHRGTTLYRLELECRSDQLARFEPVFNRFVSSFQFDCDRH